MAPPDTGQDVASVAVLQYQQSEFKTQLQELSKHNSDGLARISLQLEKLTEMSSQLAGIAERQVHQNESLARAHARLDTLTSQMGEHITDSGAWRETAQAKLDAKISPIAAEVALTSRTLSGWRGIFVGVQGVITLLLGVILWIANGYITKIDTFGERINRLERTVDKSIPTETKTTEVKPP